MNSALRRFSFQAMGSTCEVQFLDTSRIEAKRKAGTLIGEVNRLEKKYSRYRSDSFLSEINASAGNKMGIKIDTETRSLFDHAWACYEQSDGMFDITSGILRQAWDFRSGLVPDQSEIAGLLPSIGLERLQWNKSTLWIPEKMEIDFGGIVKEYAADSVAAIARKIGLNSGLVNLGGDFAVIGSLPGDAPWPVSIIHPNKDKPEMAKLLLKMGGLASSGDYERGFVYQGKRYSHILNPKTGWPCDGLRAVSVCADLCTLAGSAATIAMVKPEAEAIKWLNGLDLDYVYMTSGESINGQGMVI